MSQHLAVELFDRYLTRSLLFWRYVRDARFASLQKQARSAMWQSLVWNWEELGITEEGRKAAERLDLIPSEVFAHPAILESKPELFDYYRMLACLPNKGLGQLKGKLRAKSKLELCILLNRFLGHLVTQATSATDDRLRHTVFAEAGSEWQGSWVNEIGKRAAKQLKQIVVEFAKQHRLVAKFKPGRAINKVRLLVLNSGTTIRFGSEPDVECRNSQDELTCVIEIKGSADKAGTQTRLGETKKSFTKAKKVNPRCVTIFLPTVMTPAVEEQLRTEREIDKVFDLLDIFKDEVKRNIILEEFFKFILRERF